jgi:hypothetical protein
MAKDLEAQTLLKRRGGKHKRMWRLNVRSKDLGLLDEMERTVEMRQTSVTSCSTADHSALATFIRSESSFTTSARYRMPKCMQKI